MMSVEELAIFLSKSALTARHQMAEATKEHMEHVAKDARLLIGQERQEWASLAPATIEEKRRLGYYGQVSDTDPLLRKGDLRESIKAHVSETAEGVEGVVGSESKIAAYQEAGTRHIPPRPFTSIALRNARPDAEKRLGHLAVRLTNPLARLLPE